MVALLCSLHEVSTRGQSAHTSTSRAPETHEKTSPATNTRKRTLDRPRACTCDRTRTTTPDAPRILILHLRVDAREQRIPMRVGHIFSPACSVMRVIAPLSLKPAAVAGKAASPTCPGKVLHSNLQSDNAPDAMADTKTNNGHFHPKGSRPRVHLEATKKKHAHEGSCRGALHRSLCLTTNLCQTRVNADTRRCLHTRTVDKFEVVRVFF